MSASPNTPLAPSDMDYAEHERTYAMFVSLVKFASIGIVVIVVALAFYAG